MADQDDILSGAGAGSASDSVTKQTGSATSNPPLDSAAVSRAVSDAMAPVVAQQRQFTEAITSYVDSRMQQNAPVTQQGKVTGVPNTADDTQRVLSDPRSLVREEVEGILKTQLAPYLTTKINDDFDGLLERKRTQIDTQWGEGAFDGLIAAKVQEIVDKTPNAAAKGSRDYIDAVVRGVVGHEAILPKLIEHKRTAEAKALEEGRDVSTGVLGPGRRRPANESPFTEGDEAFMAHYAATTGIDLDKKLLWDALKVRARDGVWDTQNFPGVKNKLAVKAPRGKNFGAGRA